MSLAAPAIVSRARWTQALLAACLLVSAARLWSDFALLELLDHAGSMDAIHAEAPRLADLRTLLILLDVAAFTGCAVAWLMWQHAAVTNLRSMGSHRTRFTPGWSVGWWFIPFLNFVRVPQGIGDTWRRSKTGNVDWDAAGPLPDLVLAWWLTKLLAGVAWRFAYSTLNQHPAAGVIEIVAKSTRYDLMACALEVAAAGMAILIVQRITTMQLRAAAVAPAQA